MLAELSAPQLAMVGARKATPTRSQDGARFRCYFARAGLTITSGLALGIDAASHEGALRRRRRHRGRLCHRPGPGLSSPTCALAARIRERARSCPEFPPGTRPRQHEFPHRNRLISGLSRGTLVVEAARHSGSLITARRAAEQGREVFAIPGSIHNPVSARLSPIDPARATLVESARAGVVGAENSPSK